jgi:hypothetical protein
VDLGAGARSRGRTRRGRARAADGGHRAQHHPQPPCRTRASHRRRSPAQHERGGLRPRQQLRFRVGQSCLFAHDRYGDVEVIGRNGSLLDSAQHDPAFYRDIREQLRRHGRWSGEMWQQRKDGEEFLCAYECSAVLDANGQHALYVVVLSDITDQKRAEQELRYLANFDTLTNLPNRTLLSERLSRAIVRARRQGARIAVLFLDLDRFKDINDSLGHAAGDRILRAAAVRLQDAVGPQHTVARWAATSSPWCWKISKRPSRPTRSRARSSPRSRRRCSWTTARRSRCPPPSASACIRNTHRCRPNC